MPRGFDFLFSRNRLNVGVSRAKCLALIVASPALRTAVCERVEDVPLLNLCALFTRSRTAGALGIRQRNVCPRVALAKRLGASAKSGMTKPDNAQYNHRCKPLHSLNQEINMPDSSLEQLPHYVYVLADPDTLVVFYVGKGQGSRVFDHWAEVKREINSSEYSPNPKQKKLREMRDRGIEPIEKIVGRYETADQAFAVEATLINWTYGFVNLTNLKRGHNCGWVRDKDDWSEQRHLDVGIRERSQDGAFRDECVQGLAAAGAYDFLNSLARTLHEAGFDVRDFREPADKSYHPGESNGWLGLLVKIEGIDFMVNFSKTKTPQLWIATTKGTQDKLAALEKVGWRDLGAPMHTKVRGVGRYRPFLQASAKGSMKFRGQDGVSLLIEELQRRREALRAVDANPGQAKQ